MVDVAGTISTGFAANRFTNSSGATDKNVWSSLIK